MYMYIHVEFLPEKSNFKIEDLEEEAASTKIKEMLRKRLENEVYHWKPVK